MGDASAASLGQRIAAAQGYDPHDPSVDWVSYGRAAEYRLGKRQPVPDPSAFRNMPAAPPQLHVLPVPSPRAPAPPPPPARPVDTRRHVQIGNIVVSTAATREFHKRGHSGERATGRFRRGPAERPYLLTIAVAALPLADRKSRVVVNPWPGKPYALSRTTYATRQAAQRVANLDPARMVVTRYGPDLYVWLGPDMLGRRYPVPND